MNADEPEDRVVDGLLAVAFGAPPTEADGAAQEAPEISARYRVEGEIGRGGVGVVLRGRDVELGRDVAIKLLKPEHRGHASLARRLVEEAQIGGQLEHPGVVPVHEMGHAPDGRPFFAMRLIQGRTLAELLEGRSDPPADLSRWLAVFEQVCQTVAYAHARGVIHRDLKPANVMVGAFGEVQVADWGLAKVMGRSEPDGGAAVVTDAISTPVVATARGSSPHPLSQAGSVLGTLAYMPPEQARGESARIDARCDVFALGAMLCEILTGKPPYTGDVQEILSAARAARLGPAHARLAECGADPELVALARRCLASDREARPREASEVAEAVADHRVELQQRAHRAELDAAAARARVAEERRARRLTVALAATVVLAVAAGGGAWLNAERQRAARREQAAGPVRDALAHARELADEARRAAPAAPAAVEEWRAALAAAEGAAAAASAGDPGRELREAAAALRVEAASGLARAEEARRARARDDAAMERVGSLIGKWTVWPWDEVDAAFEREFREWGLDFSAMSDDAVLAWIRTRSDAVSVCDLLLAWMRVQYVASGFRGPRDFERMQRAMQIADPDPWRIRIRAAIPADIDSLAAMADDPELWTQEPRTAAFLGSILASFDRNERAIALFREAADRHPQDYLIRMQLAVLLTDERVGSWDEALDHAGATVALDPEVAAAWLVLGRARDGSGNFEGAISAFDRTLALDPETTSARFAKAIAELRLGRTEKARSTLLAGLDLEPDSDDLRRGLALEQLHAGDVAAGRETLLALMRAPQELPAVTRAAELLLEVGEAGSAAEGIRETLQRAKRTTPLDEIVRLRDTLTVALEELGRFEAMIAELRVTDQLQSTSRRAPAIARAQRLQRLTEELPDFASGAREPASPIEAAQVAFLLDRRGTTVFAAELWIEAFFTDPAGVSAAIPRARLRAAKAALRVADGEGVDAAGLAPAARDRFRAEALRLLRDEVASARTADALDPASRSRPRLERLLYDPALRTVREAARRDELPTDHALAWLRFFADLRAALRQVRG